MLVNIICSTKRRAASFEQIIIRELQRIGLELWSTCISVNFGSIYFQNKHIDDNYGNTIAAIVIVSPEMIDDEISKKAIYDAIRYDTIKFIILLNNISEVEFYSFINNNEDLSNFKSRINSNLIFNKNDGVQYVCSQIGLYLTDIERHISLLPRISTGISALDYLLGGGLIQGSSFNIIGPGGAGKTTLGIQMQKAVLEEENGKGCLFITYTEAPVKILRRFVEVGCNIDKYIQNGRFRIYDSYSSLNGLDADSTRRSVGDEWFPAIIRVEDPADSKTYFENQIKAIEKIGPGGVNIIDNSNKRYEIAQIMKHRDSESYKIHFSRFKARGGDTLQSIGVHIVETDFARTTAEDRAVLEDHLTRLEDGNIRMKHEFDPETGMITRRFRVEPTGQIGRGDTRWYEYAVNKSGFQILNTDFDAFEKQ